MTTVDTRRMDSATKFEHILLDRPGSGVAILTLNRPEQRNAMSKAAQRELRDALELCRADVKAIVITGNGPAFCAGIDLKERQARLAAGGARALSHHGDTWTETNMAIRDHPAICIAAVNGYALGGGLTLVNSCDLAIAANEAQIGMPEVTFGSYPSYAGPSTQLRVLPKIAAWLILTGTRIDGPTAVQFGLVNKAVPLANLMPESLELAQRIAKYDPITLDWCKKALQEIPSRISDYRAALEYGPLFGQTIRAQRAVNEASEGKPEA